MKSYIKTTIILHSRVTSLNSLFEFSLLDFLSVCTNVYSLIIISWFSICMTVGHCGNLICSKSEGIGKKTRFGDSKKDFFRKLR